MPEVDVAICVYGKPYQTVVTLASLLDKCGQHVGRIFIQEEKIQPYGDTVNYLRDVFPDQDVRVYVPPKHVDDFWISEQQLASSQEVRKSIRYQVAWEESQANFLFVSHNDCLYSGDTIGQMITEMGEEYSGAGIVGQCWNCPMSYAGLCSGDRHETFNPSYEEAVAIINAYPGPRIRAEFIDRERPMPISECRLGEFACLINLKKTKPLVCPLGPVVPFGWFTYDTGVEWFRQMRLRGHRFKNMAPDFRHSPFLSTGNGNSALANWALYQSGENAARFWLEVNYPILHARIEELRAQRRLARPYQEGYPSVRPPNAD